MRSRYRTFGEFMAGITIVNGETGGVKIICSLKNYVLVETKVKPWISPATRKAYLVKLYFKLILQHIALSKKIQRIIGYEMLGRRVFYQEQVAIIADAVEVVDQDSGEMTYKLRIFTDWNKPTFTTFLSNVQL